MRTLLFVLALSAPPSALAANPAPSCAQARAVFTAGLEDFLGGPEDSFAATVRALQARVNGACLLLESAQIEAAALILDEVGAELEKARRNASSGARQPASERAGQFAAQAKIVSEGLRKSSSALRGNGSDREYFLKTEVQRQAEADERARSANTLAIARNPDAPLGAQDMRYDRRLGGLTPLKEEFSALAPSLAHDLPAAGTPSLFHRVQEAHQRYLRKIQPLPEKMP